METKYEFGRGPTQEGCTVRRSGPADSQRMANFSGQLGYPSTAKEVRARLAEIRRSDDCAVFVAELADGQIAGWIGVYIFRSVEMNKLVEISGLVVGEGYRSRGIGKVLLDAAEEWARSRDCKVISVHSNVKRQRAHGFYKKNGYGWCKTQELFTKDL
ncbi:MAG TPA: GNAT family N-acetyltransferase [Candidatus Acidoferrales bacterium]|nr:GNAT family N-acetyltransferase [Candidatus Acidoferrales bacterium]